MELIIDSDICLEQGCTNPGRQVAIATKLCTVAPIVCGVPVWKFFRSHLWRLEF